MSFDRVAPHYCWLEAAAFGNALQRARVAWLADIANPVRALVVGEGNGRFLCQLLRMHPDIEVDCLDASVRMLQLARGRVRREVPDAEQRVRFWHEDLRAWLPEENAYNLVVTHFVLDCFTENEVAAIIGKMGRAVRTNASWLLADFALPARGMGRLHAQLWLRAMYGFFRATAHISGRELVDPSDLLRSHDFYLVGQTITRFGSIKSELWQHGAAFSKRFHRVASRDAPAQSAS